MNFLVILRDAGAWILTRYQKGYSLLGSFIQAFTFAGIYALVLAPFFDIPSYLFIPSIAIVGLIGVIIFGFIMYDLVNFESVMVKKTGSLNDYWKNKLTPIQQKQLLLTLEAIKDSNRIEALEEKVKSGYL